MIGRRNSQRRVRRRLARVHSALVAARAEVAVAEEQLAALADDAEEARTRSIVSENRYDEQTSNMAERHREVMNRSLENARLRVEQLSATELELLGQIET